MVGWNPWRALRERKDIELRWAELQHPARGCVVDHGNGLKTITIDSRLDRVQRNATLAHEMVHLDLGYLWSEDTPPAVVAKGELVVDRETMRRLVPPAELADYVRRRSTLGSVMAADVAEHFEVPVEMADRALRHFLQDHDRRRSA